MKFEVLAIVDVDALGYVCVIVEMYFAVTAQTDAFFVVADDFAAAEIAC